MSIESMLIAIRSGNSSSCIKNLSKKRQLDILIDVLLLATEDSEFIFDRKMRKDLQIAFESAGPSTTFHMASTIFTKIESADLISIKCIRKAQLLHILITSVNLQKCSQLCSMIYSELEPFCFRIITQSTTFSPEFQQILLAILIDSITVVAIFDIMYSNGLKKSLKVWEILESPLIKCKSAFLLLTFDSFLIQVASGEIPHAFLDILLGNRGLRVIEGNGSLEADYIEFILWKGICTHFALLISMCTSQQVKRLIDLMWNSIVRYSDKWQILDENENLQNNPGHLLVDFIQLPSTWEILPSRHHFVHNLLLAMKNCILDTDNQGIWLDKLAELLESRPSNMGESVRKPTIIWTKIVRKFLDHQINTPSSAAFSPNASHIISLLPNLPLEHLSIDLKTAMLGSLIVLIVHVSHHSSLQNLIKVMAILLRSDPINLRPYLLRLKSQLNWWLSKLLTTKNNTFVSDIVLEVLISSNDSRILLKKVETVFSSITAIECLSPFDLRMLVAVLKSIQKIPLESDQLKLTTGQVIEIMAERFAFQLNHTIQWPAIKLLPSSCLLQSITDSFTIFSLLAHLARRFELDISSLDSYRLSLFYLARKFISHKSRKDEICTEDEKSTVRICTNFLLAGRSFRPNKSMASIRFVTKLAKLDSSDLVMLVIKESSVVEVKQLMNESFALNADQHLHVQMIIWNSAASSSNINKRNIVASNIYRILSLLSSRINLIIIDHRLTIESLHLISSITPLLGTDVQSVGCLLSMLALVDLSLAADRDCVILQAVYSPLNELLKQCSLIIVSGMIAVYSILVRRFICAVIEHCPVSEASLTNVQLSLCQSVGRLCSLICSHKLAFSKLAPLILADYLSVSVERGLHGDAKVVLQVAMFGLVRICDKYGMAMLGSNLPVAPKHLFEQMYRDKCKFAVFTS